MERVKSKNNKPFLETDPSKQGSGVEGRKTSLGKSSSGSATQLSSGSSSEYAGFGRKGHKLFDRYVTQSDILNPTEDKKPSYSEAIGTVNAIAAHDFNEKYHLNDFVAGLFSGGSSQSFNKAQTAINSLIEQLENPESTAAQVKLELSKICNNPTAVNLLAYAYTKDEAAFNNIFLHLPEDMMKQVTSALEQHLFDRKDHALIQYLKRGYAQARVDLLTQQNQERRDSVFDTINRAVEEMTVTQFESKDDGAGITLNDKKKEGFLGFRAEVSPSFDRAKEKVKKFLEKALSENEFAGKELNTIWKGICKDPIALGVIKALCVDDEVKDDLLSLFNELPTDFLKELKGAFKTHALKIPAVTLQEKLEEIIENRTQTALTEKGKATKEGFGDDIDISIELSSSLINASDEVVREPISVSKDIIIKTPKVSNVEAAEMREEKSIKNEYFSFNIQPLYNAMNNLELEEDHPIEQFINQLHLMQTGGISINDQGFLIFHLPIKQGEKAVPQTISEKKFIEKFIKQIKDDNLAPIFRDLYLQDPKAFVAFLASLPNSLIVSIIGSLDALSGQEKLLANDRKSLERELAILLGNPFSGEQGAKEIERLVKMLPDYKGQVNLLSSCCAQEVKTRTNVLSTVSDLNKDAKSALEKFNAKRGCVNHGSTMEAWVQLFQNDEEESKNISNAIIALQGAKVSGGESKNDETAPTALEAFMEGLPVSYWVPLAGIDGMSESVVEKLKDAEPEEWMEKLPVEEAVHLTRDLVPEVLKKVDEENRPNIIFRFCKGLFSWLTWSNAPKYSDTEQGKIISALIVNYGKEADLQRLCREGNLGKLLDTLSTEEFNKVFKKLYPEPSELSSANISQITVLAQHSKRVSIELREIIKNSSDDNIKEDLQTLSPTLAITYFEYMGVVLKSLDQKDKSMEYLTILLDNVDSPRKEKDTIVFAKRDIEALLDSEEFLLQLEDVIKSSPERLNSLFKYRSIDFQLAFAQRSMFFREAFVGKMYPVLEYQMERLQRMAVGGSEKTIESEKSREKLDKDFLSIYEGLTSNPDHFFSFAALDPKCSELILGKAAQKRGVFGKVYDTAASVINFIGRRKGSDDIKPDCILERLFAKNVDAKDNEKIRETLDAGIRAHLRQEIPLSALDRYFRLVIQNDKYSLDEFVIQFGKNIFTILNEALENEDIAKKYNYDPKNRAALDGLRKNLREKLVKNFQLFKELLPREVVEKVEDLLEQGYGVAAPTRPEGITQAYGQLNPNQMLGMIRSFLLNPEDTRWFAGWRSPLTVTEKSKIQAGYLAEYLEGYMKEEIASNGNVKKTRLEQLKEIDLNTATNMEFMLQKLREIQHGSYNRIQDPKAVRVQGGIDVINFDLEIDTKVLDDAQRFSNKGTWNRTRRGILTEWELLITDSKGSQISPWAFSNMLEAMLEVLEESIEETKVLRGVEEEAHFRYITPSDIAEHIGKIVEKAAERNLITPEAYKSIADFISKERGNGTPGVKELSKAIGAQFGVENRNIPFKLEDLFNSPSPRPIII